MNNIHSSPARRVIALFISFCLVICLIPSNVSAYTTKQLRAYTSTTTLTSGSESDEDYLSLTTEGNKLHILFKHSQKFDRIVLRLMKAGKGESAKKDIYYDTQVKAGETFNQSYDFSKIEDGSYYFRIVVQKDDNTASGLTNYPTYLQGVYISVVNGTPTIQQFSNIMASNEENTTISSSKFYTLASLEDLRYQLFAKKNSSTYRTINASTESAYYKKISNTIVNTSDTDYEKLKKLFTYVAKNFYYDHNAIATNRKAFDDPYNNLKYLVNKTGNDYNAQSGKVALTCDGYAGIFTALARSQGIPCRIIYGRRITSGSSSTWENVPSSYFNNNSHTWAEAWVDGRWIIIDPQQGSYNTYGTSGSTTDKTWKKSTIINYTFFDMSSQLLAYTHYSRTVPGGNTSVSLMNNSKEISQMKSFLNTKSSGKSNGKRLNSNYTASKKSTWGTKSTFYTDGFGRIQYINWPEKSLTGKLNLSNFSELKNLTVYLNDLTVLNTKNCSSLETVYASGNNIKTVNLLSSTSLKKADYKNNPLTKAQIYVNKKEVTISAANNGTFSFKYDKSATKKVTLYPKANIGYKYTGLYNGSGKKINANATSYSFTPTVKTYKLKFALDPNSFKYYLREGNSSTLKPYNLAVQKRLKELNYYKKTVNGVFNSSTTAAVKAFQKKHGLKQTGNVDEKTWKKLFSTTAKKK